MSLKNLKNPQSNDIFYAKTQPSTINDNSIATTMYVNNAISVIGGGATVDYPTLSGSNKFTGSNAFSVVPTIPTQSASTNNTTVASTAFVQTTVSAAISAIPRAVRSFTAISKSSFSKLLFEVSGGTWSQSVGLIQGNISGSYIVSGTFYIFNLSFSGCYQATTTAGEAIYPVQFYNSSYTTGAPYYIDVAHSKLSYFNNSPNGVNLVQLTLNFNTTVPVLVQSLLSINYTIPTGTTGQSIIYVFQ